MKVRRAIKNDVDALSLINNEVQAIHAKEFPHIYKPPSIETFSSSEVSDLIKNGKSLIFIAEREYDIIGYILAEIKNFPETLITCNLDVIYIQHISVKESHRRKRVGNH